MAKLTKAERDKLPDSAFALPGRRYPIHDKAHARDALARASEGLKKKWITKPEYETIVRKANKVLDEGKKEYDGLESFYTHGSMWKSRF